MLIPQAATLPEKTLQRCASDVVTLYRLIQLRHHTPASVFVISSSKLTPRRRPQGLLCTPQLQAHDDRDHVPAKPPRHCKAALESAYPLWAPQRWGRKLVWPLLQGLQLVVGMEARL